MPLSFRVLALGSTPAPQTKRKRDEGCRMQDAYAGCASVGRGVNALPCLPGSGLCLQLCLSLDCGAHANMVSRKVL